MAVPSSIKTAWSALALTLGAALMATPAAAEVGVN